jgi:hypothetical protein
VDELARVWMALILVWALCIIITSINAEILLQSQRLHGSLPCLSPLKDIMQDIRRRIRLPGIGSQTARHKRPQSIIRIHSQ